MSRRGIGVVAGLAFSLACWGLVVLVLVLVLVRVLQPLAWLP